MEVLSKLMGEISEMTVVLYVMLAVLVVFLLKEMLSSEKKCPHCGKDYHEENEENEEDEENEEEDGFV